MLFFFFCSDFFRASLIEGARLTVELVKDLNEKNINYVIASYGQPGQGAYGIKSVSNETYEAPSFGAFDQNISEVWKNTAISFLKALFSSSTKEALGIRTEQKMELNLALQSAGVVPVMEAVFEEIPHHEFTLGNAVLMAPFFAMNSLAERVFKIASTVRSPFSPLIPEFINRSQLTPENNPWIFNQRVILGRADEVNHGNHTIPAALLWRIATGLYPQIMLSMGQMEAMCLHNSKFARQLPLRPEDLGTFPKGLTFVLATGADQQDNTVSNLEILSVIGQLCKGGIPVRTFTSPASGHNIMLSENPLIIAGWLTQGMRRFGGDLTVLPGIKPESSLRAEFSSGSSVAA